MGAQSTKELIVAAFADLARRKSVDRITVREVCKAAGVSTVTFYNHFADKAELVSYTSVNAGRILVSRLGPSYTWHDYLVDVCRGNRAAGEVLRNINRNTDGYQGFAQTMYRTQVDVVGARIEELQGRRLSQHETVVLHTYLHGLCDMLCEWIEAGMPGEISALVEPLCDAVPAPLRPLLYL